MCPSEQENLLKSLANPGYLQHHWGSCFARASLASIAWWYPRIRCMTESQTDLTLVTTGTCNGGIGNLQTVHASTHAAAYEPQCDANGTLSGRQ